MTGVGAEWEAALGLACLVGPGSSPILGLLRSHQSDEIWRAAVTRLARWGLSGQVAARFAAKRAGWKPEPVLQRMEETATHFLPLAQMGGTVQSLAFPPAGVFLKGRRETWSAIMDGPRVTVVGTRRATPYGRAIARAAAGRLAEAGAAVVSGLAFGIDAEAHRGALAAGGLTVAVVGCGANVVYPRAHVAVYKTICAQGLILSEYPPDTPPAPWRFPARNRIMAALGDALLVVEAGHKSGALITVEEALCLGRSVLAVPGPLGSEASRGCHRLIAEGAVIVESMDSLVQEYGRETRTERELRGAGMCRLPLSGRPECEVQQTNDVTERVVLQALGGGPRSVDQLATAAGCSAREVGAAVALLELRGEVVRAGTGVFTLAP